MFIIRRFIAKHINCQASELIFTSGGTEADNMAIQAAVEDLGVKRIITTTIEHHAVGHTVEAIGHKNSIEIINLTLDKKGNINLDELRTFLSQDIKTLVTLMHANNEISTLIPLKEVSLLCREFGAYLHSDTVQTMGHYTFDLQGTSYTVNITQINLESGNLVWLYNGDLYTTSIISFDINSGEMVVTNVEFASAENSNEKAGNIFYNSGLIT